MNFRIPSNFMLGGRKITVKHADVIDGDLTIDGQAIYSAQEIVLQNGHKKEYIEFVFFHELTHHILDQMGERKLRGDERFINLFSTFLHQAIKTMEVVK